MAGLLSSVLKLNGLGSRIVAEPFAGGAGASLTLLYREETPEIYINDADEAIHDFWWSLITKAEAFLEMLAEADACMDEWHRQREVYRSSGRVSRLRRGFAAFYLNRCNRSGIITNGGPIGGVRQTGKWKIDARFNKAELRRRCEKISEYRDRINVSQLDGIDFINSLDPTSALFFIDPPYYHKGNTLYLNALDEEYHCNLAGHLRTLENSAWVLTYDDCPEIRELYSDWARVRPFALRYSAAERRNGKEVLITPLWMQLPADQGSDAIKW